MNTDRLIDKIGSLLEVKAYVRDRTEVVLLVPTIKKDKKNLMQWINEEGCAAAEFLYDPHFDLIVGCLHDSCNWLSEINKHGFSEERWKPFESLLMYMVEDDYLHPFYYFLVAEIVNGYIRKLRYEDGNQLPDDYFSKIGDAYIKIKMEIADEIKRSFEREEYMSIAIDGLLAAGSTICFESLPFRLESLPNLQDVLADRWPAQNYVLYPRCIDELWKYLYMKHLLSNCWFKRCENCGKYFVSSGRGNVKYCDRLYGDSGKTCRQLMPKLIVKHNTETFVANKLFERASRTMYSRVSTKRMDKKLYKEWSKDARKMRDDCNNGVITPEEYSAWLCDNGINKDYLKEGL